MVQAKTQVLSYIGPSPAGTRMFSLSFTFILQLSNRDTITGLAGQSVQVDVITLMSMRCTGELESVYDAGFS